MPPPLSKIIHPLLAVYLAFTFLTACHSTVNKSQEWVEGQNPYYSQTDTTRLNIPDSVWKKILPANLYHVAREKGTEKAFSGKLWNETGKGRYYCRVCGNALFDADAKFSSQCGWPSFFQTIRPNAVVYLSDNSHGMSRIEVQCGRCQSHLGHIFDDGPPPTHNRFCMNSISLDFQTSSGY